MSPRATNIKAWGVISEANGTPGNGNNYDHVAEGDEHRLLLPFRERPTRKHQYLGFRFAPPQALVSVAVGDKKLFSGTSSSLICKLRNDPADEAKIGNGTALDAVFCKAGLRDRISNNFCVIGFLFRQHVHNLRC
jgi:hypothetical protein